ncbi:conserved Plasmodium protein, unknown function [Plasmodium ovale wallikeri]|uniref:CST complex subunit STN1 n=2 Tax=Plasmodium ovale TaxID=36330 RepID=A0A1A8YTP0_PLAOA|nr:conserved Plasmodium protein, unknown function [Plasmodium ovale wallikeri]SBT35452.1 conserved Plasmodium protein, unknown function [Plasmodium ovale wallikeri]SBT77005.1 conserved Plasmodium protein, unknown function [Plasmodium ovale]
MSGALTNLNIESGYFNDELKEEPNESNFMYTNISMLIRAYKKDRNKLTLLNKKLNLIKVVGFVLNIEEKKEFIVYTIDDTTGYIKAKLLLTYSFTTSNEKNEDIKVNDVIQVFGICNTVSINEDLSISISSITKLNSFNYLCHHHLLVFHNYLKYIENEKKKPKEDEKVQNEEDEHATAMQHAENPFFNSFFY